MGQSSCRVAVGVVLTSGLAAQLFVGFLACCSSMPLVLQGRTTEASLHQMHKAVAIRCLANPPVCLA